jgi:hypothetical protein
MATDVVGSKMKALNGYGQNGFDGSSSDLPGQNTTSGFLPACELPKAGDATRLKGVDASQTRTVSDKQYTAKAPGAASGEKIPAFNTHVVAKGARKSKSLYKDSF